MASNPVQSVPDPIGDAVRRRREELGLNRTEAAARSGISLQSWVDVETGVVRKRGYTPAVLHPIASVLRWPPTFLDDLHAGRVPDDVTATAVDRGEIDVAQQMAGLLVTVLERLAALEARLAALERRSGPAPRRATSSGRRSD